MIFVISALIALFLNIAITVHISYQEKRYDIEPSKSTEEFARFCVVFAAVMLVLYLASDLQLLKVVPF